MFVHRMIIRLTGIILVGSSLVLMATLTGAQDGSMIESFDSPDLPGWELSSDVTVVDGVLRVPGRGSALFESDAADFTLSIRARFASGLGEIVLSYRAAEAGAYQTVIGPGYMVLGYSSSEALSGGGFAPPAGWFEIGISAQGSQHTISIDGYPVLTAVDAGHLSGGSIGFQVQGEGVIVEFDDFTLSAPGAASSLPAQSAEALTPLNSGEAVIDAWVRLGGPPGGLGYDIRYNFGDPNIWYVTENYSGVHISTDNGLTWQPANHGIPPQGGATGDTIPIFCLTVDPHNPQIAWTGTNVTGHIYRSTDGGLTWQRRDQGITIDYQGGLSFRGFTVDPHNSDIVYAMGETADPITGYAVWGSGTGGEIFKTTNGGETWFKVWDGGIPSSLARYLWIDPRDSDVLYVSTGIFDRGAAGEGDPNVDFDPLGGLGILKSTDGGQTWRVLGKDNGLEMLYIGSLYMHPDNPDVLLAAAGHITPAHVVERWLNEGHSPAGIYRTTDGGETWTQVLGLSVDSIGEAFSSVEICPSDANIAYAGSDGAIYRSEDAGLTWERVAGGEQEKGPPGVVTGWPIDMQCDPRDPDRIFINNYLGGNFLSEDGGRTWQNASTGYTGSVVLELAVDPLDPATVYTAGRSGVWRSDDGGMTWVGVHYKTPGIPMDNEWAAIEFDPSQPQRVIAGSGPYVVETTDRGRSWQHHWPEMVDGEPRIVSPTAQPGWIVDFAFAPSDPTRIYAGLLEPKCNQLHEPCLMGNGGVLRSSDGGLTWTLLDNNMTQGTPVFNLAVHPLDADIVYAATEVGVLKSTDGGLTWFAVSGTPGENRVRAVAISPSVPPRILVGVDGIGIYVSDDGGQAWQAGTAGLEPNSSIHDIVVDPVNPSIVYTSDHSSGVYRSADGGLTWLRINDGLQNRAALGLAISADGQHLFVGIDGDGSYRLDLNGIPPRPTAP